MANSNNWGEIYKSTWWGDEDWSANSLKIDSAPPGFAGVQNLLKGSEDLDNTIDWARLPDTTDIPTVSANTITDPNGGTTAERVDFTANRQARLQQRVTLEASKQYTFSVYAKVNTGTQNFRLRNVTLGDAESKTATTSWTRFSYTFTTTTAGDYDLSLQNNDNTARTLEFWGAMLNEGATAGDYVKTEASVSGSAPTPAYSGFGDAFGGVTAYYSLRQFTEAETLNAIRVRRSSDDTEQDIGFDANGDLDTTALLAFVGTGGTDNGFVTTFYDQSGNGNNATNSTESEQPLVVSGGALVTENGKAAIQFDGVDDTFDSASFLNALDDASIINVSSPISTNAFLNIYSGFDSFSVYNILFRYSDDSKVFVGLSGASASGNYSTSTSYAAQQNLIFVNFDNSLTAGNQVDIYLNGSDANASGSNDVGTLKSPTNGYIGSRDGVNNFNGNMQELIIFNSDQSTNRTGMETNINDHFSIYTP